MATTYATNAEIRAQFPEIDDLLPQTQLTAEADGSVTPLSTLVVPSTRGFAFSGSIRVIDSLGVFYDLTYTGKSEHFFILTEGQTGLDKTYEVGAIVSAAEYTIDELRERAKGVVDAKITHPNVPNELLKELEILWVFYLATNGHHDRDVRMWGKEIKNEFQFELSQIVINYPPKIRQTIAKLVEDELTSTEISIRQYGIDGDQ